MKLSDHHIEFIKDKIPEPYNTPEKYGDFISPKIQHHGTLCTTVIAEVKKRIVFPLGEKYKHRFFCRIDTDHKTKDPSSIIDKIMRDDNAYTLDNFTTMKDLARFRIVCNFLHDVDEVSEAIKNDKLLKQKFNFETKNTIEEHPESRKSAERSIKFILEHKQQPGLFLEIQIMTQLSEAWDKKDHFLVYETRRKKPDKSDENFPDYLDAKMYAMGELLYVADNYFEALREARDETIQTEADKS